MTGKHSMADTSPSGEIDIKPACFQMLKVFCHPAAEGKAVYDDTFDGSRYFSIGSFN
jgi:hypothetical protein